MYYVYILQGSKQRYTGSTNNLRRRLREHVQGKSFATRGKGPWRLLYYEACGSEKDARLQEKYLKTTWGKRYIKNRLKYSLSE